MDKPRELVFRREINIHYGPTHTMRVREQSLGIKMNEFKAQLKFTGHLSQFVLHIFHFLSVSMRVKHIKMSAAIFNSKERAKNYLSRSRIVALTTSTTVAHNQAAMREFLIINLYLFHITNSLLLLIPC